MNQEAQRGFTLIELMVVLVIMGLIVALGPLAFRNAMPGLALQASAREAAATLREARSIAIRDNAESFVLIDVEARSLRLGEADSVHELESGLGLELVAAASEKIDDNQGRIRFFPDGTSTGGRLTLTQDERKLYVVVDWLTGRVQLVQ